MKSLAILVVSGCVVHFAAGRFLWLVCPLVFCFLPLEWVGSEGNEEYTAGKYGRYVSDKRLDMVDAARAAPAVQCFAAVSCFHRRDVIKKALKVFPFCCFQCLLQISCSHLLYWDYFGIVFTAN